MEGRCQKHCCQLSENSSDQGWKLLAALLPDVRKFSAQRGKLPEALLHFMQYGKFYSAGMEVGRSPIASCTVRTQKRLHGALALFHKKITKYWVER
jgi:hypothetical protein